MRHGIRKEDDSHLLELISFIHHVIKVDDESNRAVFLKSDISPIHLFDPKFFTNNFRFENILKNSGGIEHRRMCGCKLDKELFVNELNFQFLEFQQ